MIDPTFCRSGTGVWRRLYKKLGRPHFDPINRGSNKGSKKFEILKFELGEKLDHHFEVKFHGESNGDGPDVQLQKSFLFIFFFFFEEGLDAGEPTRG